VKLVAVGECTNDIYLERDAEMVGGISLNFAVNARRSGADSVAIVSCIGDDAAGARTVAKLEREGLDASHLHQQPGATASQLIQLGERGERIFPAGGYSAGVLADFSPGADDAAFIGSFDVVALVFFRQIQHIATFALRASAGARLRVADLLDGEDLGPNYQGVEPLLDVVDVVFISGDAPTVDRLIDRSRDTRTVIVITHGASGSTALVGGVRYAEPAVRVPVTECVDSTGCGDAFQAAFTVEYDRHRSVQSALRAGAFQAASVIRHLGATGV